jgi:hypothetical protein
MKTLLRSLILFSVLFFSSRNISIAQNTCGWQNGDLTTYGQGEYGGATASTLLLDKYYNVYPSGVFIIGNAVNPSLYYLIFDAATTLDAYLPQTTPIGALNTTLVNPTDSHSGVFGGDVAALKLNIDFSDAGFLSSNSGLKFGDLVIYGLTSNTNLNGMTVRQFFDIANTALSSTPTPHTIADLNDIAYQLNGTFDSGTPSTWAQQHLRKGWQDGDVVTYNQDTWGDPNPASSPAMLLTNHLASIYAATFGELIVGSTYVMSFGSPSAIENYLPQLNTPGILGVSLSDPTTSLSGEFGGEVVSLKLNIDFSDAGLLVGNVSVPFGNLTLCGFSSPYSALNGMTVRQFFDVANNALGGGTSSFTAQELDDIVYFINDAFNSGPQLLAEAQNHLFNGSCPCSNPNTSPTFVSPTPTCGSTIEAKVGMPTTFRVTASDADNGDSVSLSVSGLPAGAILSPSLPSSGNPDSTTFSWTPSAIGKFTITFTATDKSNAQTTCSDTIIVVTCPKKKGYWRNTPAAWHVASLTLGSQTYTQSELLTILGMPIGTGPKADASLILVDQLIAAKLNITNGANPTPISAAVAHADGLLNGFAGKLPYKVKTSTTAGHAMVTDAATLENYNSGELTSGCPVAAASRTDIAELRSDIPTEFALEQNYPNPFNPVTEIRFEVPVSSFVMLTVYDVLGREVATLVNGMQDAGNKSVSWDASNYPSGMYFYRMNAGTFTETRKLILLK